MYIVKIVIQVLMSCSVYVHMQIKKQLVFS